MIFSTLKCFVDFLFYSRSSGVTGKSLSEAFTLTSTNPQYNKRLFIDLPVQYMKTTSLEHVVYINCSECQNKKKIFSRAESVIQQTICYTYFGLIDARMSASVKRINCMKIFFRK